MTVGQRRRLDEMREHLDRLLNKTLVQKTIDEDTGKDIGELLVEIAELDPQDKITLVSKAVKLRETYNQKFLKPRGKL